MQQHEQMYFHLYAMFRGLGLLARQRYIAFVERINTASKPSFKTFFFRSFLLPLFILKFTNIYGLVVGLPGGTLCTHRVSTNK